MSLFPGDPAKAGSAGKCGKKCRNPGYIRIRIGVGRDGTGGLRVRRSLCFLHIVCRTVRVCHICGICCLIGSRSRLSRLVCRLFLSCWSRGGLRRLFCRHRSDLCRSFIEHTADGSADGTADGSANRSTENRADRSTKERTDGSTGERTDGSTSCCSDRGTEESADGSAQKSADRSTDRRTDGGTNGSTEERTVQTADETTRNGIQNESEKCTKETVGDGIGQRSGQGIQYRAADGVAESTQKRIARKTKKFPEEVSADGTDESADSSEQFLQDFVTGKKQSTLHGTREKPGELAEHRAERSKDPVHREEDLSGRTTDEVADETAEKSPKRDTDEGAEEFTQHSADPGIFDPAKDGARDREKKTVVEHVLCCTDKEVQKTMQEPADDRTVEGTGQDVEQSPETEAGQVSEKSAGQDVEQGSETEPGQSAECTAADLVQKKARKEPKCRTDKTGSEDNRKCVQKTRDGSEKSTGKESKNCTDHRTDQRSCQSRERSTDDGEEQRDGRSNDKGAEQPADDQTDDVTNHGDNGGVDEIEPAGLDETENRSQKKAEEQISPPSEDGTGQRVDQSRDPESHRAANHDTGTRDMRLEGIEQKTEDHTGKDPEKSGPEAQERVDQVSDECGRKRSDEKRERQCHKEFQRSEETTKPPADDSTDCKVNECPEHSGTDSRPEEREGRDEELRGKETQQGLRDHEQCSEERGWDAAEDRCEDRVPDGEKRTEQEQSRKGCEHRDQKLSGVDQSAEQGARKDGEQGLDPLARIEDPPDERTDRSADQRTKPFAGIEKTTDQCSDGSSFHGSEDGADGTVNPLQRSEEQADSLSEKVAFDGAGRETNELAQDETVAGLARDLRESAEEAELLAEHRAERSAGLAVDDRAEHSGEKAAFRPVFQRVQNRAGERIDIGSEKRADGCHQSAVSDAVEQRWDRSRNDTVEDRSSDRAERCTDFIRREKGNSFRDTGESAVQDAFGTEDLVTGEQGRADSRADILSVEIADQSTIGASDECAICGTGQRTVDGSGDGAVLCSDECSVDGTDQGAIPEPGRGTDSRSDSRAIFGTFQGAVDCADDGAVDRTNLSLYAVFHDLRIRSTENSAGDIADIIRRGRCGTPCGRGMECITKGIPGIVCGLLCHGQSFAENRLLCLRGIHALAYRGVRTKIRNRERGRLCVRCGGIGADD